MIQDWMYDREGNRVPAPPMTTREAKEFERFLRRVTSPERARRLAKRVRIKDE